MSLTTPAIIHSKVKMEVLQAVLPPLCQSLPIDLPVFFNNVANLEVISGSFTPNNTTMNLASSIPSNLAPNFVMLIVDGQANLTIMNGSTVLLDSNPVAKLYMSCMQLNNTYNITDIILDGTTSAATPMPQNTQVDYTLIYCQANIS